MPSRRSHSKSHHGCQQCKVRRVKCSETLPQCAQCVKRQMQCSFQKHTALPNIAVEPLATPTSLKSSRHSTPLLSTPPAASHGYSTLSVLKPRQTSSRTFGLFEMELVHLYSTKTYMTLSSRLRSHMVWRDTIFQEALRHEFLLDVLLATAAMHKAMTQPTQSEIYIECTQASLAYQDKSLGGLRAALSQPNAQNAIALFASSTLLTLWTFAWKKLPEGLMSVKSEFLASKRPPGLLLPINSITTAFIDVADLLRGIFTVVLSTESYLQGEIRELLRHPMDHELPALTSDMVATFDKLEAMIRSQTPSNDSNKAELLAQKSRCLEELDRLRDISRCCLVVEWDGSIFAWIILADVSYLSLLRKGEVMALVLLSHWAACFQCMDHTWWAKGWALSLVKEISTMVSREWDEAMVWPKQQVGLPF